MTQDRSFSTVDLRSYGRRRGRARSARQQQLWAHALPRFALPAGEAVLDGLQRIFAADVRDVWLEVGFGGGEHLLWQALRHSDVGVIGCEPFEDGVVKVLSALEGQNIPNVRLWPDDARPLLRRLPAAAIGRVFILFPDPWPKRRHHKRRLFTRETLQELARAMRPGAELRVATDIGAYASAILGTVGESGSFRWLANGPADWRLRTSDWPPTRYEGKALAAGRRCYYLRFERI